MFNRKKAPLTGNQALIHEGALILSFDTADTPIVSRFDLDSLAQANFVVQTIDNGFHLNLRDFAGNIQHIARFTNKIDAHQALHQILQALVNYHNPTIKNKPVKSHILVRIFKFLSCILFAAVLLIVILNYWLHTSENTIIQNNSEKQIISQDNHIAEGEIQDLDSLFTPNEESK